MENLICYKQMPLWKAVTLPKMFQEQHNTQVGTWAKLTIFKGNLDIALLEENGEVIQRDRFSAVCQPPFLKPQEWHKIASCSSDLECQLSFYCLPEDYTQKKYGMTKTHSEVINAVRYIKPCKALDFGCGSGRNALYLNKLGFDVTACDKNTQNISALQDLIQSESLSHLSAQVFNINQQSIEESYDFILSTVVFMFLDKERVPGIIRNMQDKTNNGGYNLIVSAMSTPDFPCSVPFSFLFNHDELKHYYQDWEIIKYNQDVGELHKTDAEGKRIKLRFATMLAKKVSE
ncbi:SAM-dependent methyltransferase TehB [Pragia fontium]|uniref:SAM-dependent methyltransferase TehB n=1 Tax=Pragia fontium TaxID=82985 RepID=UPI000F720259|nr:SAM-dependent methyltransferase TehB [Pragia fontium]VEJ56826.1 Tellurite resistance protein TehB homolog [Pragia fontium]